jgi:hypothetical protein
MYNGMKVAIIDAEIVGKKRHRFPNIVCMKISSYYKTRGAIVELKTDYNDLDKYDKVFISKVFTDTEIPGEPEDKTNKQAETISEWYANNEFLKQENIEYGGTGFYYDKAPNLPYEIEHTFPDYSLYERWIEAAIAEGAKPEEFEYYTKYSIGYATRGCFRKCEFCVNKKYNKAFPAGDITEFLLTERPYICLLDDNFLSCAKWKEIIEQIKSTGKRFQFKQGLDERLLTPDIVREMNTWKYKGEFIFAFDNIKDKDVIEGQLKTIYDTCPDFKRGLKFYVLCGYDRAKRYDADFWKKDIAELFERITILAKYGAKPYIMRYERVYKTKYSGLYAAIAAWCNQPGMFVSFTFRLFCMCRGMSKKGYAKFKRDTKAYLDSGGKKLSIWRTMEEAEKEFPEIAEKYFDLDMKEGFTK